VLNGRSWPTAANAVHRIYVERYRKPDLVATSIRLDIKQVCSIDMACGLYHLGSEYSLLRKNRQPRQHQTVP
jgi:hypothetical protein